MTTLEGHETVLVVEDEASLRRLLAHALRKQGYNVLEADVPQAAREVWHVCKKQIELVITDIVMPGGETGWDLASDFLGERADLKLLFMSGYFGEPPGNLPVNESNFIRKPFLPRELLERVRAALDSPSPGGSCEIEAQ